MSKVPNYTPEITAAIVAEYVKSPTKVTVEAMALVYGKSARSIVAKLSKENVYEAKVYTAKTGEAVVTKAELVAKIATALGVPAEDVGSLETATKATLKMVVEALSKE